jgi:hypothetical protein
MLIAGLVALTSVFVSGCATLSKGECVEADWYEIGRHDGLDGKPRARLQDHREACSEYGVAPDSQRYYLGREAGLRVYCTPDGGYQHGRLGHSYQRVCKPPYEQAFLERYQLGREIYYTNQRLRTIDAQIDAKEKKLRDRELKDGERRQLRSDIRALDEEYRILRKKLFALEEL